MLHFIHQNLRWLAAGFLLTFASAFGQTYLISLFAADIKSAWSLTDGEWGAIYTIATLAAALALFWRGSLADTMPLSRLCALVTVLFALSCLLMAWRGPVWVLGVALFGLRFCGHGMYTHMAMTATGRWFRAWRGRALSVVAQGYATAEIIWPALAVLALQTLGANVTWFLAAAILAFLVLPFMSYLLAEERIPEGSETTDESAGLAGRHWTRAEAARHWLLPALLPIMVAPAVLCTITYFQMTHVAAVKGWTLPQMAPGYPAFAVTMMIGSISSGWLLDRFGSTRLLPLVLLPLALGLGLIQPAVSPWTWWLCLGLLGLSMGLAMTLWGAVLPEFYGTRHLGAIRSLTSTVTVFITALGPGVSGLLIDAGINYPRQSMVLAVATITLCGLGLVVSKGVTAQRHLAQNRLP